MKKLGDKAIILEWESGSKVELLQRISAFRRIISGTFDQVVDLVPAYNSLTIIYHSKVNFSEESLKIREIKFKTLNAKTRQSHKLPICFEMDSDIAYIAENCKLSVHEVQERFVKNTYKVHFIGFLPGFPYMSGLDENLHVPRLTNPRASVRKGSVAITGDQVGIYPQESPGGWRIIAHCPTTLFDPGSENPALLHAGDDLTFYPVSRSTFSKMENE